MIMAKGVEDTAFYRFTKLTSLTEGGDPSVFSLTPADRRAGPLSGSGIPGHYERPD